MSMTLGHNHWKHELPRGTGREKILWEGWFQELVGNGGITESGPSELTFTWWGCYGLCLLHLLQFCSCVCFYLYGPFNCISFPKSSRQLSVFSLCPSGLISALLVLSTTCLFRKVSFSPDIILSGWLGLEHQLTNELTTVRGWDEGDGWFSEGTTPHRIQLHDQFFSAVPYFALYWEPPIRRSHTLTVAVHVMCSKSVPTDFQSVFPRSLVLVAHRGISLYWPNSGWATTYKRNRKKRKKEKKKEGKRTEELR